MNMSDKNLPKVIYMTNEEIKARIDEIHSKFPYLKERKRTSKCHCCEYIDIQEEYGYDASRAWEDLDTWKWMLGN